MVLDGREARCAYGCGVVRPSDPALAFFEFHGKGSHWATKRCTCGMNQIAHGELNPVTKRPGITSHEFTPSGPREWDNFYCGCRGWD